MSLGTIMLLAGAIGYLALAAAALSGVLKAKLNVHKALACTAVVFLTIHAAIILYLKFVR